MKIIKTHFGNIKISKPVVEFEPEDIALLDMAGETVRVIVTYAKKNNSGEVMWYECEPVKGESLPGVQFCFGTSFEVLPEKLRVAE